ncbi:DEAD/DEAH box helicase, partial [Lamprobacter modestohalophilus]|nr:DEAD/DEAH box helicase [Lamprobacter modestohalophilus]
APYQDQWGFLASIPRLCPYDVDALAQEATERGHIIGVRQGGLGNDDEQATAPWRRPPSHRAPRLDITEKLPPHIRAASSQLLFVETAGLPSVLINQIKRLAAFQNPDFYKKQAMRLSTALTPRIISCAEEHPEHLGLPRGCLDALQALLSEHPVELVIDDQRTDGTALEVAFQGELTALQAQAVETMAAHDIGVL